MEVNDTIAMEEVYDARNFAVKLCCNLLCYSCNLLYTYTPSSHLIYDLACEKESYSLLVTHAWLPVT